ncbi:MAG: hypothetical protein GWM90_00235 [Gemmatimonadetes bacterium]|nr:hypothetical protein [Gemmatimonadota bacterium]NIQ51954.1 hypothetical protein [Gemmatimonadota bacterium]NIU72057.1 hypothetical protein [Gammaproteobacteria bacterium]NIX42617.1 hypothetical protein [Gemmatimonadota bacterium]
MTGVVQITGSTPFYQVMIETDTASYEVHGEYRKELERLQGATVIATGQRKDGDVTVEGYRILEIGGFQPVVGILESADDKLYVREEDGETIAITGAPEDLRAQLGAKVWVVLDDAGTVRGYGVIRDPR